jgi:hypothetical protein
VDKWISIPYGASTVVIQGILSELQVGSIVQVYQLPEDTSVLDSSETGSITTQVPTEIQSLLQKCRGVFASKVTFPPPRSCEHSIPLIGGATPFFIRPYRYAPILKNEIEIQMQEMLEAGLIQHSSSPFSSPVLLVKKKDKTYRFCVDYRHLNAITLKEQYHVPIIEELLDELYGASWFSSLDLCAGFHQIPMNPADCFKTAFQTHVGHYEFRVMLFGLTGAPHTF